MFLLMKRAAVCLWAAMIMFALAQWSGDAHAQPPAAPGAAPAAPAAPPADPKALVGDWTTALEGLPGGPQLGELHVKQEGDKLTGTVKSPLGEVPVETIKVVGPNHVLSFNIDAMNQALDIEVTTKVTGNKFDGSFVVGGGMMQAAIKGAKVGSPEEAELKKYVEAKIIEIIGVPTIPVEDVKSFLGSWVFKAESPMGGDMDVEFEMVDVGGKGSGKLVLPPPLGAHTINKIEKTASGITMRYQMEMMGNPMDMTVDLERKGPMVTGLIDVGGGMFQLPLDGVKKGRGLSKMALAGKNIMVEHGRPSTSGPGYQRMTTMMKDGFIWRMGKDEATTLATQADLKFGDKEIKAGHYSLWAKRVGDNWHLLFNKDADVWGTKHIAGSDVAEIPLESKKLDTPVELVTIEVKPDPSTPGGGIFRLAWGDQEGTAKFTVVQPPAPAPAGGTAPAAPGGAK